MEKLSLKIIEVENGYIVTVDDFGRPTVESQKYVAKNPTKLSDLIEKLAVAKICERQTKGAADAQRGEQDHQSGSPGPSEKRGSTRSGHFDPARPSHDGIDRAGRSGPRIDNGF